MIGKMNPAVTDAESENSATCVNVSKENANNAPVNMTNIGLYLSPSSFLNNTVRKPVGNMRVLGKVFHKVSTPNKSKKTIDIQLPTTSNQWGA